MVSTPLTAGQAGYSQNSHYVASVRDLDRQAYHKYNRYRGRCCRLRPSDSRPLRHISRRQLAVSVGVRAARIASMLNLMDMVYSAYLLGKLYVPFSHSFGVEGLPERLQIFQ